MCYVRKYFNKEDIKQGQLLEFINKNTKEKVYYIVYASSIVNGLKGETYKESFLINKDGETIKLSNLDKSLNYKALILNNVYGDILFMKAKNNSHVDIYDPRFRPLLHERNTLIMNQQEALQLLARQINKNIVIV